MQNQPVFIVGAPRSGTTLLAAMLSAHSRMCCGPETHFFRRLAQADAEALVRPEEWPEPGVRFLASITHTSYSDNRPKPLLEKHGLDIGQVKSFLSARPPSIPALLSSVTEQYMQAMGKHRWVEKTPDHILHLEAIRRHFPSSPIIRIVRDPRDVALSLTKLPWGSESFTEGLLHWRRLEEASRRFFESDTLSHTLLYEDLLKSPREELGRLCRFIGEEFEEGMLDTSSTGKQINTRNVPWKDKVSQPIDPSRLEAWRKELTPGENLCAEALLGDCMKAWGYPVEGKFDRLGTFFPSAELVVRYATQLQVVAGRGVRFWKEDAGETPKVRVYVGDPDAWLGRGTTTRVGKALAIGARALAGGEFYWMTDSDAKSGIIASLLKWVMGRHRVRVAAN